MPEDSFSENGRAPDSEGDAWMDARVEAYVDDALPPEERAAFEERLQAAPRWQRAVRRARQVKRGLRALPQPESCPPEVTQAVLDQTVRSPSSQEEPARKRSNSRKPRRAARPATPGAKRRTLRAERPAAWQPALAMAALLAVAVAAALLGRPAAEVPTAPKAGAASYTHAEVERAETQAKWALALVAEVTRETVREDVLGARAVVPMRKALAAPATDALPPAARRAPPGSSRPDR